jgi:hypothetical protein
MAVVDHTILNAAEIELHETSAADVVPKERREHPALVRCDE